MAVNDKADPRKVVHQKGNEIVTDKGLRRRIRRIETGVENLKNFDGGQDTSRKGLILAIE